MFKIVFSLLYFYMILLTTKKEELCKGLGLVFNIFNNRKVISDFFNNIYSFIIIFIEEVNDTFETNSIKGEDCYYVSIIEKFNLFFKSYKDIYRNTKVRNKDRKECMKYRLFDVNVKSIYKYRTRYKVFDYILILFYVGLYAYYIVKVR